MNWRRFTTRVVIFLLLGAVLNVAVAWGIAFSRDNARMRNTHYLRSHSDDPAWFFLRGQEYGSDRVIASLFRFADVGWEYLPMQVPQWSMVHERPAVPLGTEGVGLPFWVEASHGWPRLSMVGHLQLKDDWRTIHESQWAIPIKGSIPSLLGGRFLPLRPLWSGFIINAIVYAAPLWVIFAGPFTLRRWRRTRRGLCPACGYPSGSSAVCSECGATVTSSAP